LLLNGMDKEVAMALPTLNKETRPVEPFGMMRRLSSEMDRMFQGFPRTRLFGPDVWRPFERAEWTPDVEVFTRDGNLVVRADLPGMTEKDVTVEVADNLLTVSGERKQEKEVGDENYFACERTYGAFTRAISLPEGAKSAETKATFKNGVLEVTMPVPKAVEKHGRTVEVQPA
jgi:HSP20 family protein